ncbi:MAG: sensor histidine kinase [Vicinamibacterales bacterium]
MSDHVPPPDWLEAANLHATVAQLLSTVIHQVNNALQTIGGHAELLKTDPGVTETTKRRAGTITTVTERTADMLASLQVLTRPSQGSAVLNLRDVATRALAFRQYGLGRARIRAVIEGVDQAPVFADPRPLTQAVLNVIMNAEQAMTGRAEADGVLTIRVGVDDGQATLQIEDNGPGLQGADGRDLPEHGRAPVARALGANLRLGLGLWTAGTVLERAGGTLSVAAGPAGGTLVRIALPLAVAATPS